MKKFVFRITILFLGIFVLYFIFCLPTPLFQQPYATIIEDEKGELMDAHIAADGQWRFPYDTAIDTRFLTAIRYFEDEHFYQHPGVNPFAMYKAFQRNYKAGRVVSGGSTLSMQVVRLYRNQQERTLFQKIIEVIHALRLELSYSKRNIILNYVNLAPFGGNVVGVQAAAWRYYHKSLNRLSWGEISTLAVLPNAPALIYPGRNRKLLIAKRNRLLLKLLKAKVIDASSFYLACKESIPDKPSALPNNAPHLVNHILKNKQEGKLFRTSINAYWQQRIADLLQSKYTQYKNNEVYNLAALVVEVKTGCVKAYLGNVKDTLNNHGYEVDIITARRSSGSILKPFLFAAAQMDGSLLSTSLMPDIPTQFGVYTPENSDKSYRGAVPASEALQKSLNIPFARLLRDYGIERFYNILKQTGIRSLNQPYDYYGLSLILGGAEVSMWDLASAYSSMARVLNNFAPYDAQYDANEIRPVFIEPTPSMPKLSASPTCFDAASIFTSFDALKGLTRPNEENFTQYAEHFQNIAWKTGTSFGNRDAWSVGITPHYVVVVWAGNASGEGRPNLTGINYAAPILFDIFKILPYSNDWFVKPYADMVSIPVCKRSGFRSSMHCSEVDTILAPRAAKKSIVCPFEQLVHLDMHHTYRVNSSCASVNEMWNEYRFALPPVQEYYYKLNHPFYQSLPPMKKDCDADLTENTMSLVYPKKLNQITLPVNLDGHQNEVIFEVAYRNPKGKLFWHLDGQFVGMTEGGKHKMPLKPELGKHNLSIVDEQGTLLQKNFNVVEPNNSLIN